MLRQHRREARDCAAHLRHLSSFREKKAAARAQGRRHHSDSEDISDPEVSDGEPDGAAGDPFFQHDDDPFNDPFFQVPPCVAPLEAWLAVAAHPSPHPATFCSMGQRPTGHRCHRWSHVSRTEASNDARATHYATVRRFFPGH